MSLEKVEIPLFTVVSDDPLQQKLDLSAATQRDETARKELDGLLLNGWREIGSGTYMTPRGAVLCVVLFKDERPKSLSEVTSKEQLKLYLQPVWDENN